MKKYRILEKHYRGGELLEHRVRYTIQEYVEGWFSKGWRDLTEPYAYDLRKEVCFDDESKAQEYLFNLVTPLPDDRVVASSIHRESYAEG